MFFSSFLKTRSVSKKNVLIKSADLFSSLDGAKCSLCGEMGQLANNVTHA